MKRLWALALALVCLAGCAGQPAEKEAPPAPKQAEGSHDLAAAVTARPVEGAEVTEDAALAATGFGLDLFRESMEGTDPLVSPLSVLQALAMTANGAAGDTLEQMEDAFGLDREALNVFMLAYWEGLGAGAGLANGIWLNDGTGLAVKEDFLQTNADYYGASVTARPFDEAGRDEINAWVAEHTAGRPTPWSLTGPGRTSTGRTRCGTGPSPMPPGRGRARPSCGPRRKRSSGMSTPWALSSTTRAGITPSRRCCRRRA